VNCPRCDSGTVVKDSRTPQNPGRDNFVLLAQERLAGVKELRWRWRACKEKCGWEGETVEVLLDPLVDRLRGRSQGPFKAAPDRFTLDQVVSHLKTLS